MRNLHNYNIGHRPFPYIKGGMIGDEEYHTAEEYHSVEEEEPEDERIQHFDEVMSNFTTEIYDKKPNDYKQIELQYAIDFYNGLKEYQKPFIDMLEKIRLPDQPPLTFDEEGFIETEPQVQWALKHYPIDEDDEDDEDLMDDNKIIQYMKVNLPENMTDLPLKNQKELLLQIIDYINKETSEQKKLLSELNDEYESVQAVLRKELKRGKIQFDILKKTDPEKYKDDIADIMKTYVLISKNINMKNIAEPLTQVTLKDNISHLDKESLIKLYAVIAERSETTKLSNMDGLRHKMILSITLDVLYPSYYKLTEKLKNERIKLIEYGHIKDNITDNIKDLDNEIKKEEKLQTKKNKESKEQNIIQQRSISKSIHETKLEKEIEERKKKEAEQAKQAAEVEPVEPTISKAKAKKNKAAKKSEEDKEFETIKNYAQDRIERINSDYTGNGKVLETFFTELGEPILQYITRDRSKIHDNELNERIPDEMVMYDNGEYGSLRKAVTIDLYNDNNAIEIKNYKQYDKNKNDIEEPNIPLQLSKYEGTKYFIPLYLENGKLYNIQLIRYDEKTNAEISRSFILPNNPEGRNLFTVYRLADGLYKFDPSEHKSIKVKYNPIEDLKTPEGKQLYAFDSMNLGHCKDHNGRESFNVKKYLTKIKI